MPTARSTPPRRAARSTRSPQGRRMHRRTGEQRATTVRRPHQLTPHALEAVSWPRDPPPNTPAGNVPAQRSAGSARADPDLAASGRSARAPAPGRRPRNPPRPCVDHQQAGPSPLRAMPAHSRPGVHRAVGTQTRTGQRVDAHAGATPHAGTGADPATSPLGPDSASSRARRRPASSIAPTQTSS